MFDYIVVGSGPSGLLVNGELSKAKLKGLCLEQGKLIKSKVKDVYTANQIIHGYKNSGINPLLGYPPLLLSEGECLGGGSILNSSLHHRVPKSIWNKWVVNYDLQNFSFEYAQSLYEEIEEIFSCSLGDSEMPIFYKTASKYMKVERISRWGNHDQGQFERKTAYDVAKEHYSTSIKNIKTNVKVVKIIKDRDNSFTVLCEERNLKKNITYKLKSKYLFLCSGAGSSPILLSSLGYRHKRLGLFKVHPTARISLATINDQIYSEIVEPFQITEFFPELMIGSSANRDYLSELNYPFRNKMRNFKNCLNLYSMAPSNQTGKIILNGIFKGLKFYFLDNDAKNKIKFGLKKIIKIASEREYSHAFSPGGEISLNDVKDININNFINATINKTLSSVHIFSSAACGGNSKYCPINSNGSVPGFSGIYLMDSSIIPSCPTVNPQSTVSIFALKMIREFLK